MPVLFAGSFLIFAVIIIVIGAVIIWAGKRSDRKKILYDPMTGKRLDETKM